MKTYLICFAGTALLGSAFVHADAFDEKARAAAAREEQASENKAHVQAVKELTQNNLTMVRRVPHGASITSCYDRMAFLWRNERNGCRLANTEWNGVPVQICTDGFDETLPPEIVECHYHVAKTGRDCQIVRNASIKPVCL